jgi:hypothetical protein
MSPSRRATAAILGVGGRPLDVSGLPCSPSWPRKPLIDHPNGHWSVGWINRDEASQVAAQRRERPRREPRELTYSAWRRAWGS